MAGVEVASARWNDRVEFWIIVAVCAAVLTVPLAIALAVALGYLMDVETWVFNAITGFGLSSSILSTIVAGALIGLRLTRTPRTRLSLRLAAVLGTLAGASPVSAFLFFRLQYPGCVGLNVLGVPWPEPWQSLAQLATAGVVFGAVVLTAVCLFIFSTRRAAVTVLAWFVVAAIPTSLLFFLSIYGDPGPGCIGP
jgi:hypothetical protein